jgi:flagellar biogenesis protein FliO
MDEWSVMFTAAALIGVLLTFLGAWWMVRAFRARKPRSKTDERRSHSSGPAR